MRWLMAILLLACGGASVIPTPADSWLATLPPEARACTVDDECVAVELDCCGCSNDSGVAGAVHRDHLDAATERRNAICGDLEQVVCLDALSGHVSCWGSRPACIDHVCQLVER